MSLEMREKVFLGLLSVCFLHFIFIPDVETAVSEQMLNQMKAMHKKTCMGKSGVSQDSLAKFMEVGELDDPVFKKYVLCMCKQLQVFKKGAIQLKEIESQAKMMLPPALRDATLEATAKCTNCGGESNPEDMAYCYIKCCHSVNKKNYPQGGSKAFGSTAIAGNSNTLRLC